MYVVQVASECAPVAKVGGLGVVYGLSRELQNRIHWVEVVLPRYDCMRYDRIWGLEKFYHDLWVPWCGAAIHCSVWAGQVHGIRCLFIEPYSQDNFFTEVDTVVTRTKRCGSPFSQRPPWSSCRRPTAVPTSSTATTGWERFREPADPEALEKVIDELRRKDNRFHVEGQVGPTTFPGCAAMPMYWDRWSE